MSKDQSDVGETSPIQELDVNTLRQKRLAYYAPINETGAPDAHPTTDPPCGPASKRLAYYAPINKTGAPDTHPTTDPPCGPASKGLPTSIGDIKESFSELSDLSSSTFTENRNIYVHRHSSEVNRSLNCSSVTGFAENEMNDAFPTKEFGVGNKKYENIFGITDSREKFSSKQEDTFSGEIINSRQVDGTSDWTSESCDFSAVDKQPLNLNSSVSYDDLGLTTHRPELASDRHEPIPVMTPSNSTGLQSYFRESMSDDLHVLLGEEKYAEFVQKSMKDLEMLNNTEKQNENSFCKKASNQDVFPSHQVMPQSIESAMGKLASTNSNNKYFEDNSRQRPRRLNADCHKIHYVPVMKTKHHFNNEENANHWRRNYDQISVPRNVVYSSDEIYQQAYGSADPELGSPRYPSPIGYPSPRYPVMIPNHQQEWCGTPLQYGSPPYTAPQYGSPPYTTPPPMYGAMAYNQAANFYYRGDNIAYSPPHNQMGQSQNFLFSPPHGHVPHPPMSDRRDGTFYATPSYALSPRKANEFPNHFIPRPPESARGTNSRDKSSSQHSEEKGINSQDKSSSQHSEEKGINSQVRFSQSSEEIMSNAKTAEHFETHHVRAFIADSSDHESTTTAVTGVEAGGITARLEELGIDLSLVKGKDSANTYTESKKNVGKKNKGKGKKTTAVKVCPECKAFNKAYMSFCCECGEVIIDVEKAFVSKRKKKINGQTLKEEIIISPMENEQGDITYSHLLETEDISLDQESNESHTNHGIDQHERSEKASFIENCEEKEYENKDSGRPSSGEGIDQGETTYRTEKEMSEICDLITDPTVKSYVKAHFDTKRQAANILEERNKLKEAESNLSQQDDIFEYDNCGKSSPEKSPFSLNFDGLDSHDDGVWLHELSPDKHDVPVTSCGNDAIDIEVFTMEESKTDRLSRKQPVFQVPGLDLNAFGDGDTNERSAHANQRQNESGLAEGLINKEERSQSNKPNSLEGDSQAGFESAREPVVATQAGFESAREPVVANMILDNRVKPQRPRSAESITNNEASLNNDKTRGRQLQSKDRQSLEGPVYKRHWTRSSTAWSSYNPRELNTRSSLQDLPIQLKQKSRGQDLRPNSGGKGHRTQPMDSPGPRPSSAGMNRRKFRHPQYQLTSDVNSQKKISNMYANGVVPPLTGILDATRVDDDQLLSPVLSGVGSVSALSAYSKYLEMTPRINDGAFSHMQFLPDELVLLIFSHLMRPDLASCTRVSKQFHRVATDESLWKVIELRKKNMCDKWLREIGKFHPTNLSLIQCHGDAVSDNGLRDIFRECADSLRELNFSCCSRGAFIGDNILLHASSRCRHLSHVDASWCSVTDNGISAISDCCSRLESVCMNGCQSVTDEALEILLRKHGKSLRVLEMFGCFNITPKGIRSLGNNCSNLHTLNLGQCYKLTGSCISQLSVSLNRVVNLDLRGCKQIDNNCIRSIVRNCPRLTTIALANCPKISDAALTEIGTYLTDIRSIDACGCKVTDTGLKVLARNCHSLRHLDISSTGCTHKSVLAISNYCSRNMETLKLNFLGDMYEKTITKLVRHCKKLTSLHLYGCIGLRNLEKIKAENRNLTIEM